jgi:multiple sugar transport system permease protein
MGRKPLHSALRLVALALAVLWSGFPILLIVTASLKPSREIFRFPPDLIFVPTFENYVELFARWPAFVDALVNSLIVTVGATALTIAFSTMAGYGFSRLRSHFLTGSAFYMILVRMFPPIIVTLPLFPVVNYLRLNDTHLILIIIYCTCYLSLGSWIMKTFMDQIPRELDEAAVMDGATLRQILVKVILPLSAQGIVAVGVFVFIFSWNEYLFAFIFTATEAKTGPLILAEMLGSIEGVDWGILFAAATVELIPILVFVLLVQRFIVAGLTAGSVKG